MNILLTNNPKVDKTVALIPNDVQKLTNTKFQVFFTRGVGAILGINDSEYIKAGAKLVNSLTKNNFKNFDIILSPSILNKNLYKMSNPNQVFWFYGYLVNQTKSLLELLKSGAISICSENIHISGDYKFLNIYDEIKGNYAISLASYLLANNTPSTLLPSTNKSETKTTILILNYSYAGYYALKLALAWGCDVIYLDQNPTSLKLLANDKDIQSYIKNNHVKLTVDSASFNNLLEYCKKANVLITTNQLPTIKTPVRITKEMISNMIYGGVFIDLACESGLSSEFTTKLNKTIDLRTLNHIVHYALNSIPPRFNLTWSQLYSENLTNCLLKLKDINSIHDISSFDFLKESIITMNHNLTNQDIAQSLHLLYTPITQNKK